MTYYYDLYGWHTEQVLPGRDTEIAPPADIPQGYAANFTGHAWLVVPYTAPPAPVPEERHITRLAFLDRFADAEAIAIDLASIGATVEAAAMRRYVAKVNAASYIDLDRADTRAGVQQLETAGLLAVGRAAEILDAPVQDAERA